MLFILDHNTNVTASLGTFLSYGGYRRAWPRGNAGASLWAIDVSCDAPDQELLLVDWLNALVYEMATRKMLFSRFEVTVQKQQLIARAWGEKIDIARHEPTVEIKGATYTELKVAQLTDGSWI